MTRGSEDPRPFAAIRYAVALAAFGAAALFVAWKASNALLLIFAGVLFGAFLDGLARLLGKVLPWGHGVRLAIVCAVLGTVLLAGITSGSTAIAQQASELATTLREQINQALAWLQQHGIQVQGSDGTVAEGEPRETDGRESSTPTLRSLLPDLQGLFGTAWTAIAVVVGALGNAVVILFLGIFFAAQPAVYRDGLVLLVPPRRRARVGAVLDEAGETLRHWLLGQALTMSVIFVFTWLGLELVGVQPAFVLGLQAGVLAFIPTLGPLIAGIPIMLAGFAGGVSSVVGALAVYVAVQTLESYLLTPMIQRRAIEVPPAFLFAGQIVLGLLFGLYGLALATPLAAVARVFILRFYVEERLGDRRAEAG
jgi:predicted PurR-regulated permease PerM